MLRSILPALALALLLLCGSASGFGLLGADQAVPASPAAPMLGEDGAKASCQAAQLGNPLMLYEAVNRALCWNPKTREAWAEVKLRAATLEEDGTAFLPVLNGTWQGQHEYSSIKVLHHPELDTQERARIESGGLSLGWLLVDFGHRQATLDSAQQLLSAAQANLDSYLQQAFMQAARDYYSAQSSSAAALAATGIADDARHSAEAAHNRVEKGVAPISDELQARTVSAQAILNQARANVENQTRLGALAIDMGLDPDTAITLPDAAPPPLADADFLQSAHELIEQAKRNHPSVAAAEHQLASAQADERVARTSGYPTLSLNAKTTWSNQPTAAELGLNPEAAHDRDSYFGVQVQVPLFDGFAHHYQIQEARAQTEIQRGALIETEQQVAQDVWASYQALKSDTENLKNSQIVVDSAQSAFVASQQRYRGGAANILELLSVQTALANAQEQRIQALADWRTARLQLAASLGKLGMDSLEK